MTIKQVLGNLAVYSLFSAVVIPTMWVAGISDAEAVPAFARKYDMSCNVCHTRQPRLNPFGQRFLENGYQIPGTSDGGVKEKHLLGGELNGATLDEISNYMAVRLRADVQQASFVDSTITEASDDPDIIFPNVVNIFFAGTATDDVSFFFETEYATQGGEDPALRFERSYLAFNNVGGKSVANIKIGNFDPSAMYSFPTHRQMINPIPPAAETNGFPPAIDRVPLLPLAFSSKMFGLTRGPSYTALVADTAVTANGVYTASGGPPNGLPPLNGIELYDALGDTVGDGFSILPFEPMFYNAPAQRGISVHGRPFGNSFLYQVGVVQALTAEDEPQTTFDPYVMLRYDMLGKNSNFQVSGFLYKASKAARPTLRPAPMSGDGAGNQAIADFNANVLGGAGVTGVFFAQPVDWTRTGLAARWQYKSLDIYGTIIKDSIDTPDFGNGAANTSVWETDATGISLEADWLLTRKWLLGARYDSMSSGGLSYLPAAYRVAADQKLNQDASFLGLIAKYYRTPSIGLYARYHFNLESSAKLPARVPGGGDEHPATNLDSMITVGVDMAF